MRFSARPFRYASVAPKRQEVRGKTGDSTPIEKGAKRRWRNSPQTRCPECGVLVGCHAFVGQNVRGKKWRTKWEDLGVVAPFWWKPGREPLGGWGAAGKRLPEACETPICAKTPGLPYSVNHPTLTGCLGQKNPQPPLCTRGPSYSPNDRVT